MCYEHLINKGIASWEALLYTDDIHDRHRNSEWKISHAGKVALDGEFGEPVSTYSYVLSQFCERQALPKELRWGYYDSVPFMVRLLAWQHTQMLTWIAVPGLGRNTKLDRYLEARPWSSRRQGREKGVEKIQTATGSAKASFVASTSSANRGCA
jgi:hypothetical protein